MTTTLEPPPAPTPPTQSQTERAATEVRESFAACRLKFRWFGTSKTLSQEQKTVAAESFGAEGKSISAGKKLIDTKHDAYSALTAIRSEATQYWKTHSLPYPEPGIRLIRHDSVENFDGTFEMLRSRMVDAVDQLQNHFDDIKTAARERLGSLYDASDYPVSLIETFAMEWDFPSVDPPDYLRQLNPALFEQQAQMVSRRFEQAVELAEQAFIEELEKLVSHLSERLAGDDDGKPKIFRDSAVSNLTDFFDRFRNLNVRSNAQLDQLVGQCEQAINGVDPQSLRGSDQLRRRISTQLSTVQSNLDQLLVERPRRNILRPAQSRTNQTGGA